MGARSQELAPKIWERSWSQRVEGGSKAQSQRAKGESRAAPKKELALFWLQLPEKSRAVPGSQQLFHNFHKNWEPGAEKSKKSWSHFWLQLPEKSGAAPGSQHHFYNFYKNWELGAEKSRKSRLFSGFSSQRGVEPLLAPNNSFTTFTKTRGWELKNRERSWLLWLPVPRY